ncbi:MAG: hypothetical protein R2838_02855 [Caldilineaceae bacterium]
MLRRDWLANTVDPLPVFSALVAFTYRFLHPWLFYLYQAFLLGLYLCALLGIVDKVFGLHRSRAAQLLFLTVMIWLHSSLLPPSTGRSSTRAWAGCCRRAWPINISSTRSFSRRPSACC